jgi:hypothetical protein
MAEREFLRSIDARVARTNEILEADRLERERALAGQTQSLEDIRVELRQQSLRGERLAQGYLRRLEEMSEQARVESAEKSAAIRHLSDQIRANTRAVLLMLDERGGGGPAAA